MGKHLFQGRLLAIIFFIVPMVCFGLEVDQQELIEQADETIIFTNYLGPHEQIDSREEIIGIGVFLGSVDTRNFFTRSYGDKYTMVHAVDTRVEEGLEADIFVIQENASVDHIRNMRWILQGFLSTYYDYNQNDAATLAEFITYYNAVFRNDLDYMQKNYSKIVIDNLSAEKIGLSKTYEDWPGNSQVIIPLTEEAYAGEFGALDSDVLTDEKVIEDLRKEEDKGIEPRQKITELKEREVEEEKQKIEEEKQKIVREEQQLEEDKEALEERKQELSEKEKTVSQPQPQQEQQQEQPSQKAEEETHIVQAEIETEKEAIEEEERRLAEKEEELAERKEAVEQQEEQQEQREERIKEEREQIAEDKQALIAAEEGEQPELSREQVEEEPTPESPPEEREEGLETEPEDQSISQAEEIQSVPFLIFTAENGQVFGTYVLTEKGTSNILRQSTVDRIASRSVETLGAHYVAIAQTSPDFSLILLNGETLELEKKSDKFVYKDGYIYIEGDTIYTVIKHEDNWHIGKFDQDLNITEISETTVVPYTYMVSAADTIFVQGSDGKIIPLNKGTLQ